MDIKVGSIYRCDLDGEKIRIDQVNGHHSVKSTVIDSPDKNLIGTEFDDSIDFILRYFKPVYTIEGFEV